MAVRRSATNCRALNTSVPGWKMTERTESPWIDEERMLSTPAKPLIEVSIGWVTSTSTCSGLRPGASVWIETCGGANSGKTPYLASPSENSP